MVKKVYNGFGYSKNKTVGERVYYRCSTFKRTRCPATLICGNSMSEIKGVHTCESTVTTIETNSELQPQELNPVNYINNFIVENANLLNKMPFQIYEELLINLRRTFAGRIYTIPSQRDVYNDILSTRGHLVAKDLTQISLSPLKNLSDGRIMLRRHWKGDIDGDMHEALIWSTDEALALMRYNGPTFIDATFKTVPSPFVQCLIVLVYDRGSQLYVPCVYSLQTSKSEYMYCTILHELVALSKYTWMPSSITIDFEKGLVNACKHEFPESYLIGCYFHLKQALHRKLKKLNPNQPKIYELLTHIELLTILPIEEIEKGIQFIKFKTDPESIIFNRFWNYFTKTWIGRYGAKLWNISQVNDEILVGRTNNALERYNRRFGEIFMNAHPNITAFVMAIRSEFEFYSERCEQIRKSGETIRFDAGNFVKTSIDAEYISWKNIHHVA